MSNTFIKNAELLNENQIELVNKMLALSFDDVMFLALPKRIGKLPCGLDIYDTNVCVKNCSENYRSTNVKKMFLLASDGKSYGLALPYFIRDGIIVKRILNSFDISNNVIAPSFMMQGILNIYTGNFYRKEEKLLYDSEGRIYSNDPVNTKKRCFYNSLGKIYHIEIVNNHKKDVLERNK